MRKLNKVLLLIILLCFLNEGKAQYIEKEANLISRYRPGVAWYYAGNKPYKKEKLRKYDRLIVDVVFNDWYGDREVFSSPWNSMGLNIALFGQSVLTKANTVSFAYGLSFSHFNNKTYIDFQKNTVDQSTEITNFLATTNVVKNKFTANYLEVPLEFRFRTKGYHHFKWMFGGKIGYQLNTFTKQHFQEGGNTYVSKNYNFPDNNRWRYGVTARMGVRNIALYGAFYFSELFQSEESVQLTPLSIGVSISLF